MIFGCLFVMLASFLVLMAGFIFLNYSKKEQMSRSSNVVGWASIVFALFVIVGLTVGGIVRLACGKCGHGGKENCYEQCDSKGSCSGYSGATREGKMSGGCGQGKMHCKMRMGDRSDMEKMHEMHMRMENDSVKKEVIIIQK